MDNSTGKKIDDLLQCMLSINNGSKNEDNYEYRRKLIEAISYVYICSLGNKADSRKAAKVVQLASCAWHSELMDAMQSHVNKLLIDSDGQHLAKVCHGLEENKLFREAVNQDIIPLINHINQTMVSISKHFNSQTHDQIKTSPSKEKEPTPESTNSQDTGGVNSGDVTFSRSTMNKMDLCYTCVKVCLLTFQYLPEAVAVLLSETSPAGQSLPSNLVNNLQAVLSQGYSKDCNLIAGSALAMLLNTVPTVDQALNLVQLLSHDVETVKIGNIEINGLSHDQTYGPYSKISLFRGILTCCKPRLLLSTNKSKDSILLHSLFCEVVSICQSPNHSILYNAFQLFVYWFESAIATVQQYVTSTPERKTHFHCDSLFVKTTLQLVWENWQNPLSGVSAFVKTIFGLLLEIHQKENHLFGICSSDFYQSLASHLLQISWHVKGKYTLLCSLVPYVGALNLLSKHPTLPRQLMRGLATNFLASAVSDLHKVLLKNMVEEVKLLGLAGDEKSVAAAKWKDVWGECVVDVLCSETDLIRFHGAQYWLPWILKCFPGAYELLVTSLKSIPNSQSISSKRRLHGVVMVMAQARHADIVDCKIIETNMASISTALYHVDDDIRLHALALICNSPRKAEPIQQFELDMLQRFLPLNMNCDGASFRQKMCAYIKVIITRIRNSCLSSLKILARKKPEVTAEVDDKTEESERILMSGITFLDWLLKDLVQSLFPGACYQRKRAALGLLEIMFELMLSGQCNKRKTKTPENTNNLIKWAQQHGMCNFICERTCSIFLECLLDGSNDIRDLAYKLLSTYFSWPLPKAVASQADGYGVFSQGLRLISSPKSPECEAGAKLCMLVFQRHVLKGTCTTSHLVGTFESSKVELMKGGPEEALSFLNQLTEILAHQLKCCSTNILKGSFTTPMHGILLTIRNCLTLNLPLLREVMLLDRDGWSSLINNLIDISSNIVTLAMSALGGLGGKIGTELSPSFADMGEGINDLVEKMKDCQMEGEAGEAETGIQGGDESPAMSADYQLIMACCWLNLKEVSLLLAELSQFAYLPEGSNDAMLTTKHLHTMTDMFVNILTKCRHRGAIEGCNIGFSRLCASLLSSSSQELAAIPRTLVEDVIHLITNEGSTTSFTKKSAGLPLLVEAVINSEPRGREKTLLHFTMTSLLKIAQEPEPVEHDPKIDLPQCHALNMLKALFRSAAINDDVMPYTSKSAIIAINGFASKHFSIRNGSMLLFGSLVARMFGQKRVQDEHSRVNSTTAHEFFVHYPELQSFLLKEICKCIDQQESGNRSLHPSLFPVLIILSKLGCGLQSGETSVLAQFVQPVMQLSSSPVYQVRSLTAEALVPLVAEDGILLQAVSIINKLPQSRQELVSQNQLHGQLLQIQKLFSAYMDNCQGPLPSLEVQTACRRLCEFQWIGRNDNKCPLTRAVFVDTVTKVVSWTLMDKANSNASVLADEICNVAKCCIQIQEMHQISDCVLSISMVNSLLSLNQTQFIDNLQSMFKSRSPDVILSAQLFLLKHIQRGCQTSIQSLVPLIPDILNMVNSLKEETSLLENTLKLFVEISVRCSHNLCVDWPRHWDSLLELANGVKGVGVSCAAIPALGVIMKGMLCEGSTFRCDLQPFCRLLIANSQVTSPETCRFAVASSLKIVGAFILKEVQSQKNEENVVHALSIFSAALNLLQDETTEIRCEASQFVSNLSDDITDIQLEVVQPSNALQMLIKYMCQSFRWSNVCFSNLFSRLVGNSVEINIKNQSAGTINLFEQDDANIYWEPAQLARVIHKELTVSVTSLAKEDLEALRSWVMSYLTKTKDQINRLHKQLSTKTSKFGSFFVISGSSKSYSVILCQLLQVDLLVRANRLMSYDAAPDFSQLYITITDLTKIENLHPFLQDQMNEIINHEQTKSSNIEDNL